MTLKTLLGIILGLIIVSVLIFGLVTFVRTRFFGGGKVTGSPSPSETVVSESATASASVFEDGTSPTGGTSGSIPRVYQSGSMIFRFPQNWGVLTCSNSANFEFDPYGAIDQKVVCDRAQKPITVLVNNNLGCSGENVMLGGLSVTKSRIENVRGVDYRWCFSAGGQSFNITHRVSGAAGRGLSKDDFYAQIEQMIGSILPRGGS